MKENYFNQDNTSTTSLEKNGIMSCGQTSRHINIRHFFIKNRVKEENINIIYCPTEIMIADYFTKPLQGELFKYLRDVIMGHTHPSSLLKTPEPVPSPSKERAGICMPVEASSTIMDEVSNMLGDGTNINYDMNPACDNTLQTPTYTEIVGKVRSTARRETDQAIR